MNEPQNLDPLDPGNGGLLQKIISYMPGSSALKSAVPYIQVGLDALTGDSALRRYGYALDAASRVGDVSIKGLNAVAPIVMSYGKTHGKTLVKNMITHPLSAPIGAYAGSELFKLASSEVLAPYANELLAFGDYFGIDPNTAPYLEPIAKAIGFHVGADYGAQGGDRVWDMVKNRYSLRFGQPQQNESGNAIMGEQRQPQSRLIAAASIKDPIFAKAYNKQMQRFKMQNGRMPSKAQMDANKQLSKLQLGAAQGKISAPVAFWGGQLVIQSLEVVKINNALAEQRDKIFGISSNRDPKLDAKIKQMNDNGKAINGSLFTKIFDYFKRSQPSEQEQNNRSLIETSLLDKLHSQIDEQIHPRELINEQSAAQARRSVLNKIHGNGRNMISSSMGGEESKDVSGAILNTIKKYGQKDGKKFLRKYVTEKEVDEALARGGAEDVLSAPRGVKNYIYNGTKYMVDKAKNIFNMGTVGKIAAPVLLGPVKDFIWQNPLTALGVAGTAFVGNSLYQSGIGGKLRNAVKSSFLNPFKQRAQTTSREALQQLITQKAAEANVPRLMQQVMEDKRSVTQDREEPAGYKNADLNSVFKVIKSHATTSNRFRPHEMPADNMEQVKKTMLVQNRLDALAEANLEHQVQVVTTTLKSSFIQPQLTTQLLRKGFKATKAVGNYQHQVHQVLHLKDSNSMHKRIVTVPFKPEHKGQLAHHLGEVKNTISQLGNKVIKHTQDQLALHKQVAGRTAAAYKQGASLMARGVSKGNSRTPFSRSLHNAQHVNGKHPSTVESRKAAETAFGLERTLQNITSTQDRLTSIFLAPDANTGDERQEGNIGMYSSRRPDQQMFDNEGLGSTFNPVINQRFTLNGAGKNDHAGPYNINNAVNTRSRRAETSLEQQVEMDNQPDQTKEIARNFFKAAFKAQYVHIATEEYIKAFKKDGNMIRVNNALEASAHQNNDPLRHVYRNSIGEDERPDYVQELFNLRSNQARSTAGGEDGDEELPANAKNILGHGFLLETHQILKSGNKHNTSETIPLSLLDKAHQMVRATDPALQDRAELAGGQDIFLGSNRNMHKEQAYQIVQYLAASQTQPELQKIIGEVIDEMPQELADTLLSNGVNAREILQKISNIAVFKTAQSVDEGGDMAALVSAADDVDQTQLDAQIAQQREMTQNALGVPQEQRAPVTTGQVPNVKSERDIATEQQRIASGETQQEAMQITDTNAETYNNAQSVEEGKEDQQIFTEGDNNALTPRSSTAANININNAFGAVDDLNQQIASTTNYKGPTQTDMAKIAWNIPEDDINAVPKYNINAPLYSNSDAVPAYGLDTNILGDLMIPAWEFEDYKTNNRRQSLFSYNEKMKEFVAAAKQGGYLDDALRVLLKNESLFQPAVYSKLYTALSIAIADAYFEQNSL